MAHRVDETYAQLLTRAATCPSTLSSDDKARLGDDIDLVASRLQAHIDLLGEHIAAILEHRKPKPAIAPARQLELLELARAGRFKVSELSEEEYGAIDFDLEFMQLLDRAIEDSWEAVWPGEAPLTSDDKEWLAAEYRRIDAKNTHTEV